MMRETRNNVFPITVSSDIVAFTQWGVGCILHTHSDDMFDCQHFGRNFLVNIGNLRTQFTFQPDLRQD
jgi:hypothetical protein